MVKRFSNVFHTQTVVSCAYTCTVLPHCCALLAVTPPPPPPPQFSGERSVKGYFTSITRPPPRGLLHPVCGRAIHAHVCMLQVCKEASIRKSSEGLRYRLKTENGAESTYDELKRHSGGAPCRKATQSYHGKRASVCRPRLTVLVLVLYAL